MSMKERERSNSSRRFPFFDDDAVVISSIEEKIIFRLFQISLPSTDHVDKFYMENSSSIGHFR